MDLLNKILPGYKLVSIAKSVLTDVGKNLQGKLTNKISGEIVKGLEAGYNTFYASVTFDVKHPLTEALIKWLKEKKYLEDTLHFSLSKDDLTWNEESGLWLIDNDSLIPDIANLRFSFNGKRCKIIQQEQKSGENKGEDSSLGALLKAVSGQNLTLIISGGSCKDIVSLIETLDNFHKKISKENKGLSLYIREGSWWDHYNSRPPRDWRTIFYDQKEEILKDAKDFLSNKDEYFRLGIPHRRGYLLEGMPGTGKSSLIQAVATELKLPIFILPLNSSGDTSLLRAFLRMPRNIILLIEDIDAAGVPERKEATTVKESPSKGGKLVEEKLTLSTILNGLDGCVASEGRLLFVTTNNKGLLDPALIRPGRIDRIFHFDYCTPTEQLGMCKHFLGCQNGIRFNKQIKKRLTHAELQVKLMQELENKAES